MGDRRLPTGWPTLGPPASATLNADAATQARIEDLAAEMRANSERWFQTLHADDAPIRLDVFYALGMAGEVGEVANLIKKLYRDGIEETIENNPGDSLGAELADVFTYLLLLADEVGIDLVAEYRKKAAFNEARWG